MVGAEVEDSRGERYFEVGLADLGARGLPGLCLLAPVTIGPQATAVIALAAGERPSRIMAAIALGVAPWCAGFAALTAFGFKLVN